MASSRGIVMQAMEEAYKKQKLRSVSSIRNEAERYNFQYLNFGFCVVVGQEYAVMLHRFQKFHSQLGPGVNFKIPFIDTVAIHHDMRERVIEIPPQQCVTKDNVSISVDGVIYVQVTDPMKASYNVEDFILAITNLGQTTIRSEIGKMTMDETFYKRQAINESVVEAIKPEADEWGVQLIRYEVMDIDPPVNIQNSMILQAEAERNKRAEILASEGSMTAAINKAEAKKQA